MGSLSAARAELAHLQRRELQLFQELSDVRKALTAQKAVLDEFVKASAVPYIDRLPNELLAEIFLLLIDERRRLVSVSRRWRAVICDTGKMWGEIDLEYDSPTMQKLYLERSREAPLTLTIGSLQPKLDVFLPHANRWHTLNVLDYTEVTLSIISQIILPSLRRLFLDGTGLSLHDVPTMRSWAPALKHLELMDWKPPLPFGPKLCQIVPAESLEELSITRCHDWKLEKDSMHLPSLRRLALEMRDPIPFLEAIVAPELTSFCFTPSSDVKGSISNTFAGNKTKFKNVSHLTLSRGYQVDGQTSGLFKLLCQVFCGVHHAHIPADYVQTLFPRWGKGGMDHCTCIESLEIQRITLGSSEPFKTLIYWFKKRTRFGRRKLHLKLTEYSQPETLSTVFQRLQEYCASVLLVGVPVSPQLYLPMSAGSLLSSSPTYSVVNV